ncbi:MAG: dTDP-4-dehydrorhamnose reductase [Pseudomonadota bacterium]
MKNVLIIGSGGQVSTALRNTKPNWCTVKVAGRSLIDLTQADMIRPFVATSGADLIINAAAYTNVDKAEEEPKLAEQINAIAPGQLALGAADLSVPIIHISTDYVFNGEGQLPYKESDSTGPLGVYGRTKLAGEKAVAMANQKHVVVRTAWVFSAYGQNFVKSMLKLGAERDRLGIVADQFGSPTSANDLSLAIWLIGERILFNPQVDDYGVVHAAGSGIATWYDLAKATFSMNKRRTVTNPTVEPILTREYPTPARRPKNSRLDLSRLEQNFGIKMRPWHESLSDVIDQIHGLD